MNVDAVYCISVSTAIERQETIKKEFPVEAKVELFVVERDTEDPRRGAYESHSKLIEIGKKKGFKRILILEDDADQLIPWTEIVKRTNECLQNLETKKWKYLMLGYYTSSSLLTEHTNMIKIQCACGGQAYIANLDSVESTPYIGHHIDTQIFCNTIEDSGVITRTLAFGESPGVYGVYPPLIGQKDSYSSTINPLHTAWLTVLNSVGMTNQATISLHVHVWRIQVQIAVAIVFVVIAFYFRHRVGNTSILLLLMCFGLNWGMLYAQALQSGFVSKTSLRTAEPLPDRGFDLIPNTLKGGFLWDLTLCLPFILVPLVVVSSFALNNSRLRIAILSNFVLLSIFRILTLSVTAIPSPVHDGVEEGQYKNMLLGQHTHSDDEDIVGHFDMMFSGHTSSMITVFLWCLVLTNRINSLPWLFMVGLFTVAYAVVLISMRAHYTMDILIGAIISTLLFYFCYHKFLFMN